MAELYRRKALDEAMDDSDSTKARILRAAEDLFANQGYKGTTTKEISDDAGVNIALIHYHWGTKAELWNAVHAAVLEQGFGLVRELMEKYPRVDTLEELRGFVGLVFDYHIEHPNLAKLWVMPGIVGGSRIIEKEKREMLMEAFAEYIKNCTPARFEPGDITIAAFLLLGAFRVFFFRPDQLAVYFGEKLENPSPEFREKAVETLALLVARFGQMI